MISEKKLKDIVTGYTNEYEGKNQKIKEIIGNINKLDFIGFLSAINRITSHNGRYGIEPSTFEFLIGIAIRNYNVDEKIESNNVEDVLSAWKLGDELIKLWTYSMYFRKLDAKDSKDIISKKIFEASMKINYGLTRGYSWYRIIEERHIKKIFDGINNEVKALLGFYPSDIWKVVDGYERYITKKLNEYRDLNSTFIGVNESNPIETYELLYNSEIKKLMWFRLEDIEAECLDVSKEHLKAIFDFYTLDLEHIEKYEYEYITDENPFIKKPILKSKQKYCIPFSQRILWIIRESIENVIKEKSLWNKYDKNNKAKYLEDESVKLFRKLLPQCDIYSSLYYYPEESESGCELDAIALYDDIIILIECKSGIYTKAARRGGMLSLESVIYKNIEYAYKQGDRTRQYILNSKEAVFYEKNNKHHVALKISSQNYRKIFIINTTLDYFSELGVDLYKLKELGLYKEKEFPWTICLSDLEVISDYIEFPNQFIYYMMMRSKINNSISRENHIKMLYELDLFAMYKLENLKEFNEYDCEAIEENILIDMLDEKGEDEVLEIQPCVCKDFTLFFFEFYDKYLQTGKKPEVIRKLYNEEILDMCKQLENYKTFGYSSFIFRFLDMDFEQQNEIMSRIHNLCQLSKKDNKMHELTIKRVDPHFMDDTYGIVIYVGYNKDRKNIDRLAVKSGLLQHGMTGIKDWITLCIYLDDDSHFVNKFYYYFGDSKSEKMAHGIANPIPVCKEKKIGRNDLCPCGSGNKYKRCCGRKN